MVARISILCSSSGCFCISPLDSFPLPHQADIVKVGIGPGSVCTTRKQTGVGYPQLSAVIECADAAHGLGGFVCADGGITCPGDAAKAFGGGSDFIMMGGMFAGTEEAAGTTVERDGKKYKQFYGMSSNTAMVKHAGGVAEYRSSEGKTVEVRHSRRPRRREPPRTPVPLPTHLSSWLMPSRAPRTPVVRP